MPSDTRDRIVTATSEMFRARGYHGTSLKHVTAASGAPIGSVYHFFPGGKVALAEAVITESGAAYRALFELIADAAPDPVAAVRDFFEGAAEVLVETGYLDACPIGTVALEVASSDERLRRATAAVFASWEEAAVERLVAAGLDRSAAAELATTLVAAIEGGFMLSRAAHSPDPMRTVGRAVCRLVESALAGVTITDGPRPSSGQRDSDPRWIPRDEFVRDVIGEQADPGLAQELRSLTGTETTDDLPRP